MVTLLAVLLQELVISPETKQEQTKMHKIDTPLSPLGEATRHLAGGPLRSMDEVIPRKMQWLWYPYIPMGSASMIFGPGGLGKSHIAVDIASRVSNGYTMPFSTNHLTPQKVLILTAEDDPEVVLQPRLFAAGAKMPNILIPDSPFILDERGVRDMVRYMEDAAATVVFIDPIVAWMGGKIDMNKMNEVRTVTGALHQAAMRSGSAVILVHHSRKEGKNPTEDYEKAAGSADFNNAVRSVMFVSRDPEKRTWFSHVKSNYSRLGPPMIFSLDTETDKVIWGNAPRKTSPTIHAIQEWLLARLADGPVPTTILEQEAAEHDFAWRSVIRAKEDFAESFLKRADGRNTWYWRLK